jgi:hypothetical protein
MAVNLVSRVQKLLMSPKTEWDVIDKEPTDVAGILTTYVGPLVVISAVAALAGLLIFGINVGYGIVVRPSITSLLIQAVIQVVLGIVMVYVFAFIVDMLATTFGAQKNFNQAFKLAAYTPTASWVAGIAQLVPMIGWIVVLAGGIYSLYLLFIGLPKLMKPPADKAVVYTLACIGVVIVLAIVVGLVVARVTTGMMT